MILVKLALAGLLGCQVVAPAGQSAGQDTSQTTAGAEGTVDNPITLKPGDGVTGPRLIYYHDPEYTDPARKKRLSGMTIISLVVDTEGNPQNVHVVQSLAEGRKPKFKEAAESLDRSAVETVEQYRFEPARKEGKPVAVQIKVEVNFQL